MARLDGADGARGDLDARAAARARVAPRVACNEREHVARAAAQRAAGREAARQRERALARVGRARVERDCARPRGQCSASDRRVDNVGTRARCRRRRNAASADLEERPARRELVEHDALGATRREIDLRATPADGRRSSRPATPSSASRRFTMAARPPGPGRSNKGGRCAAEKHGVRDAGARLRP